MAKYAHIDVLDGGLNAIKNGVTKMLLIKAYTLLDSYETVVGNSVCSVDMSSTDFPITGADGANRVLTVAQKSQTATGQATGTPDLHIAFTNGVDKVLIVTDETSNQTVEIGNTINFPTLTYTRNQPT